MKGAYGGFGDRIMDGGVKEPLDEAWPLHFFAAPPATYLLPRVLDLARAGGRDSPTVRLPSTANTGFALWLST